jgi:hypothetical protein
MINIIKKCREIGNFESSAKLVKEAGYYQPFRNKFGRRKQNGRCFG